MAGTCAPKARISPQGGFVRKRQPVLTSHATSLRVARMLYEVHKSFVQQLQKEMK